MKYIFSLLILVASFSAVADEAADDTLCSQQQQAFASASAVYDKDHSTSRTFWRSFYQNGASASVSFHDAQMKAAMDDLAACRALAAQEAQAAKDQAERDAYNARPEVRARNEAIRKANAATNGAVNVATFTPNEWMDSMGGMTPWIPLGKTESKAFFYTFVSRNFDTYINIKMATLGAGDDYVLMEFITAQLDCRPGHGYPAALPMPMTYSYNIDGAPLHDDYKSPFGTEVPIEHGTILAAAVIGTCDAVRKHNGTVNYQ